MFDLYDREITDLRISVTQKCNLMCPYCHKEGEINSSDCSKRSRDALQCVSTKEMPLEMIQELVGCAAEIGIKNVKITGGEPLLRPDICEIIESIARIKKIRDVSLTTNGFLLEKFAPSLKRAGLKRINIGCDSISSNIVSKRAESILPGLLAAKKIGFEPIKLNMVVLKGINHNEIDRMIEFAREYNVILQLIELLPTNSSYYEDHYFNLEAIEKELEEKSQRVKIRKMQARKQYYFDNTVVEIVIPTHKLFCRNCTKLRITSDGKIKPCLMRNDNLVDFKDKASFIEAIGRRSVYNESGDDHSSGDDHLK